MPASITLSKCSWSTPDGRALFSDLELTFGIGRVGLVGRNGIGKTTLLKLISGELRPHTGSITVNGTLGILRQTIQATPGEAIANLFGITDALALLRRAENGEACAEELADADWTLEARVASALARLGLDAAPETHLATLSGGQSTRARLAALIFTEPDFLLLDEPTNNLDREGRAAVIDFLAGWRGGAIIVSHDRELLEAMDAIVEMTSLGATRYGGGWSQYRERKAVELAAARHDLADAEKRVTEIDRKAQESTERKARKDRAGQRKRAKGDLPRILTGMRKDRSEDTSGASARLADRQRTQAFEAAASARKRIEILQPLSVVLPPTHLPASKSVLTIDAVSAGYEPDRPIIKNLSFSMTGPERVAVVGPNGSGKTTLLALVAGQLQPWHGTVRVTTDFAMFDQQVSLLDPSVSIRDNFRRINRTTDENACRAALARFMFRSDAALQLVFGLSGGQLLRAGLACVLGGPTPPSLLILDEPTNHLDIGSIEAVEAGLRAYDGALLIVSHDEAFLESIAVSSRLDLGRTRLIDAPSPDNIKKGQPCG
ncbi:MAG: ABC-F family ATP-binding cassette domain-containing protein [Rhizobiales bacterium]|nr:ABC-F family ATP-binding cassette domain-containing protein [Hyphomicrobiales bacterium]